jgi:hypothetical protein
MLAGITSLMATSASGQTVGCEPVSERAGREFGCFITARTDLGALPNDSALYWHIDAWASSAWRPPEASPSNAPRVPG